MEEYKIFSPEDGLRIASVFMTLILLFWKALQLNKYSFVDLTSIALSLSVLVNVAVYIDFIWIIKEPLSRAFHSC